MSRNRTRAVLTLIPMQTAGKTGKVRKTTAAALITVLAISTAGAPAFAAPLLLPA